MKKECIIDLYIDYVLMDIFLDILGYFTAFFLF